MKVSANKYFILAIAGAIILGAGLYLLLNNYFEKVEIIVAQTALAKDKIIEEKDIAKAQYYKGSLPQGYITDASDAIGRVLLVQRQPKDPITDAVFEDISEEGLIKKLNESEVLIALNISYVEPIVDELIVGSRISIVSAEKDKDLQILEQQYQQSLYSNSSTFNSYNTDKVTDKNTDTGKNTDADNSNNEIPGISGYGTTGAQINEGSLLGSSSFFLSENIMVIDGQLLIKNLEIVNLCKDENKNSRALAGSTAESTFIFLKCDIKEAPIISRVTKDNNYKIVLEKS